MMGYVISIAVLTALMFGPLAVLQYGAFGLLLIPPISSAFATLAIVQQFLLRTRTEPAEEAGL